jgi:hypothetical protein
MGLFADWRYWTVLLLAIVLIVLGGVTYWSTSSAASSPTAVKNIKNSAMGVISIGVLFFLISISAVGLKHYINSAKEGHFF